MSKIKNAIMMYGLSARGRGEILKYLDGQRLTQRQGIVAKCYSCMGYYIDGKSDCKISDCSLYPWMPYRKMTRDGA